MAMISTTILAKASPRSLAAMVPHELLVKIFYNLEERPQHRHTSTSSISFSSSLSLDRTHILACALVCRDWYYAAVDTLWREVDLQSVESFILFSRALDPGFSYIEGPSSSVRTTLYHTNERSVDGADHSNRQQDSMDEDEDEGSKVDSDQEDHENEMSGDMDDLHQQQQQQQPQQQGSFRSVYCGQGGRRPRRTGRLSLSSTTSSESDASTTSTLSSCSSSSSTNTSPYSMSSQAFSDHVGIAGQGYIRSFSVAGTSDCQAPRPFPYLPSCITDRHLVTLSYSLTQLTSLSLCHCTALTDMSVIQLITASSPSLRLIDLAECRLITNLTVQVIAQLCSQLEELSLQGCGLVTDDAIEELAHHCTRLTKINLGRCFRVSDRSLLALLRSSGRMTPTGFSNTRERTRNARLTKLGIAGCHGVTLAGLMAIERYLSLTPDSENGDEDAIELNDLEFEHDSSLISLEFTCPALKKSGNKAQNGQLFLTTAIMAAHANISQASRFFNTLPRTLEEITIHDAHTLSHDDVICLVDRVGPSLKTLRFDNANAVSTDTLTHILTMCPHLTELCIPRATRLDDTGVAQLKAAKCAQSLVELDLSACHTLTDACLISLATSDSSEPSTEGSSLSPRRNSNGKSVCGREQVHRFPNLRRLDLSYNDKMTLTGIIPLVMSLKSLCALDVSFCGEGVTRSWNSSFESLRSILNPSAVDSPQSPSEQGNNFNRNNNNSHTSGANTSNDGYGEGSSSLQSSSSSRQLQEQTHQALMTTASTTTHHPTSPQNVQQITSGVNNMTISGRRGLGGYVGPRLNRPIITTQNNDPTSRQYPGQRGSIQEHPPQQDQSSSSSPSTPRFTEFPTIRQQQDQCSHGHYCNCNSSTSSFSPRIILADRLDILEYTPRRVGIPARFYLESWFTPQHQSQLQQLFQIQLQRQRDLQDQQAGAAAALLTAAAAIAGGYGYGHGIVQGNVLGFSLGNHGADVASLSPEMMAHPVMVAARAGVATLPLNGGQGLGLPGEQRAQNQHLPWQHRQQQQQPVNADTMEMNDNLNWNLRQDHRQQLGGRFVPGMVRRHHHRQYHHRRESLNYGGDVMGHCEISAWGLSKLREEWAMS